MSEIVGFVALSDNEDDNKEKRRQPLVDVETVNRCTRNALSTHTSQLISYETKLYTSGIWNTFVTFKDNPIIFLSVMSERTTLLRAQTNVSVRP
jgi:putative flippase GtrA